MGRFDKFVDAPGAIKSEGMDIELNFQRLSDTTGRVSWNVPSPSAGCNSANQAYDGIVITVSSQPANYLSTSPVNGIYYEGDPSVNSDLNTGSRLDAALVVGAFYDDKVTTFLDLTDLTRKTAYYFSGYAVDNVARYHREGVHSYSLPTGPGEPNSETDLPAIQDVVIESADPIAPDTFTGLVQGGNYAITCIVNGKKYQLVIPGTLALDYDDLVNTINKEFIRLTDGKYVGTYPPNAGNYYVSINDSLAFPVIKVYLSNGYTESLVTAFVWPDDPSSPIDGTFWFDGTTLWQWGTGAWHAVEMKSAEFNFANPACYKFWFDGTNVYEWEKVLWCQLPTYVQDVNPLLPPALDCNTFWYNTNTNLVSQWDVNVQQWNSVNPIYYDADPNAIVSGAFWFNQTDGQVYYFAGSQWNQLNNVIFADPDAAGNFVGIPSANNYWFVASTQKLYRRDAGNTVWVNIDTIIYTSDPRDRVSCQLWWNATADVLNIWDVVNTRWIQVSQFFQQANDPSAPVNIPLNSAWMNSDTGVLTIINNPDCTIVDYVTSVGDPTQVTLNDIWYQPSKDTFWQWDGSDWQVITVIGDNTDPFNLHVGDLWFNSAANELNQWDGSQFNGLVYSITPLVNTVGGLWYNPLTEIIYEWNGITWVQTIGIAAAKLILRSSFNCEKCKSPVYSWSNFDDGIPPDVPGDTIRFYTKGLGCKNHIKLCYDDGMAFVFANIKQTIVYSQPIPGYNALDSAPNYEQIGVGTDGSPDERRKLDSTIRTMLGVGATTVELTKNDIDTCINNALKNLRKNSNLSVRRGFFFLDVFPKQQTYYLKDKCVGFNKITMVSTIYRTRGGGMFGASALNGGDGVFAYSMLQNLYQSGSFDMLSYHLVSAYTKDLQNIFADFIMFQFTERDHALRMYQTFWTPERVLLDATIDRTEQDLLTDRETAWWIQRWCVAEAKMILSQSRGKFQVLAGPNGNVTLNAQDLISQAQQEMEALNTELYDYVNQDLQDAGMRAHFLVG